MSAPGHSREHGLPSDDPSAKAALRGNVAPQATTHSSQPDLTDPPTLVQKPAAEAVGTFAFVVGCGALTAAVLQTLDSFGDSELAPDAADLLYRSSPAFGLFFGLVLIGVGFAFGRVSGGHANPAVTLASAAAGRLAWIEALAYVGAQLAGAVLGGATVLLLATGFDLFDPFDVPLGASGWGDASTGYAWWAALVPEVALTAILALVFLGPRPTHPATRHGSRGGRADLRRSVLPVAACRQRRPPPGQGHRQRALRRRRRPGSTLGLRDRPRGRRAGGRTRLPPGLRARRRPGAGVGSRGGTSCPDARLRRLRPALGPVRRVRPARSRWATARSPPSSRSRSSRTAGSGTPTPSSGSPPSSPPSSRVSRGGATRVGARPGSDPRTEAELPGTRTPADYLGCRVSSSGTTSAGAAPSGSPGAGSSRGSCRTSPRPAT